MDAFEQFELDLRGALTHLYDPIYRPSDTLWAVSGCDFEQGARNLQAAIIRAIEDLKPSEPVPPDAQVKRVYELLHYRYVEGRTQQETAEHLGITPRYLRRLQWKAIHVLASLLWEHRRPGQRAVDTLESDAVGPRDEGGSDDESTDWLSQVREELASLSRSDPTALANVAEMIGTAADITHAITSKRGIALQVGAVKTDLVARIHPSALRQVLVEAIAKLSRIVSSGGIEIQADGDGDQVAIYIKAAATSLDRPSDLALAQEILAAHDGTMEIRPAGGGVSLILKLRPAPGSGETVSLLVVDDNEDLVGLYRSYAAGTRYEIAHVVEGQRLFEAVEASAPDIIVLDVMLPDVDGWELLMQVHEDLQTRSIPVVVCSVIREEELALALGATVYLPKPVRRREFIQALDRVLSRAEAEAPGSRESNVVAD